MIIYSGEIGHLATIGRYKDTDLSISNKSYKSSNSNIGSLEKINFQNVRSKAFTPQYKTLQWLVTEDSIYNDEGLFVTFENDKYLVKSVFNSSYAKILLNGKYFVFEGTNITIDSFIASPDLSKVIIRSDTVKNWRHSSFGTYYLYDISHDFFSKIGENIAVAHWSPDSQYIAYILANNLYVYSSKERKTIKQVTTDGSELIFNGKPDWVYEEEVITDDYAFWWSPNSRYIVFFKINETEVKEFPIPYYAQNDGHDLYPELRVLKYPKPGTPNPVVELDTFDLYNGELHSFELPDSSYIISEVVWVGDDKILAKATNRGFDNLFVYLIDASDNNSFTVVRQENSGEGWHEIGQNVKFIPRNDTLGRVADGYIDIKPINGFNHLVYAPVANSSELITLTSGEWEVVDGYVSFDYSNNDIYFVASKKSSIERHLYLVNLFKPCQIIELTDTSKDGWYTTSFSAGGKFALLTYGGPTVPYQKIINFRSDRKDDRVQGNIRGETLYYLEKNANLTETLKRFDIPEKKFGELNLGQDKKNDGDVIVNYYEVLPNNFNPALYDYYPVLFFPYGGPNSQQVTKTFSIGFNQIIASQLNAIVVVVDGRGTGFKGKKFRSVVRDNLGYYEAIDQINAAKHYASLPYVNKEKIAIWGWSYGGYLTLKTLEHDSGNTFRYGIAVAPVTDYRLYDSIYTERYMHTPQENPSGYAECSVHNVTSIAQSTRFLLMHGTGDDNVHFQHTLKLLDMLDLAGIENYDVHVFTDSDHSISFHNANNIIFDKLLNWIRHAFNDDFINW
ncbi:related to Dipeptidyl aminopeptidase B [Saccharomycodes ludwigii]|uniref:Related to Dipeptidyl aminopeptidase B n=1 Tax=Saccharomycodes ludwigii TaxID=36035 RepID=A0A376BBJ9_9ASCO|nr:related to Dipeptidyl aminopeptidase B [Saccharomycodes ludwigii]